MRNLDYIITLPRNLRTKEENYVLTNLGIPFAIKFKAEWEKTCKQLRGGKKK